MQVNIQKKRKKVSSKKKKQLRKRRWIAALAVVLVIFAIWTVDSKDESLSMSKEMMKRFEAKVDTMSKGKVQVNWKEVAAVYAIEYDDHFKDVTNKKIETITQLFMEKNNSRYELQSLNEVADILDFSINEKKRMKAYARYLQKEALFTSKMKDENNLYMSFITEIKEAAKENYDEYGILPSITISQAILESDWGRSKLSLQGNNLFGIKGHNWNGKTTNLSTKEFYDKQTKANFRVYDTIADSVKDHGAFLSENPRYKRSGVFDSKTYTEQAMALQKAGYSTAENEAGEKIYSKMLIQLIQQYQLQLIDSEVQLETNHKWG